MPPHVQARQCSALCGHLHGGPGCRRLARPRPEPGVFIPCPVPGRMQTPAGFGSAHGRFHSWHAGWPGDSQGECVTARLVLAVSLANVLQLDYLTPDAVPCGAGTRRPRRGRRGPNPPAPLAMACACSPGAGQPSPGRAWGVTRRLAGLPRGVPTSPGAGCGVCLHRERGRPMRIASEAG